MGQIDNSPNIAAMAASMAEETTNSQEAQTNANATADTAPNRNIIGGPSLTIEGPGGVGGPGGLGGIGDGRGGAGQPGGLGGVGGFLGVGDNNPGAKMVGYSLEQLAQQYPDIANKIVSLAKDGDLQSAAAAHPQATADVKGAFRSEMKDTAKDIVDHPFAVDEVRTPGGVGGPGQVGGLGGLQHPLGDLAAKSVEQLANEYPNVANYLKSIAGDGNILNLAQEDSSTAVRNQMQADTPTNIAA